MEKNFKMRFLLSFNCIIKYYNDLKLLNKINIAINNHIILNIVRRFLLIKVKLKITLNTNYGNLLLYIMYKH